MREAKVLLAEIEATIKKLLASNGGVRGVETFTVVVTDAGFSPRELTIKAGDTVAWVNKSTRASRPASAIHPTHTLYPGSDIQKCRTDERNTIFDSCSDVQPGESWSFTFREVGSWKYHNHLQSSVTGAIIVQ